MVTKWKAQFVANIEGIFRDGRSKKSVNKIDIEELLSTIDRLEMENDFLKKKSEELLSLY
jgi:hypothetical protein